MEFSRKEQVVIESVVTENEPGLVQLDDLQLLTVGGGVADVTFS